MPPKQEPDDTNVPETKPDPTAELMTHIYETRSRFSKMPPRLADKMMDKIFDAYMAPRYAAADKKLDLEEMEMLKSAFKARMLDIPGARQTPSLEGKVEPPSRWKSGQAMAEGEVAGALGGIRKFSELMARLDKTDLSKDPIHKAISKAEGALYQHALSRDPDIARIGAAYGHQVPALAGGEAAAGAVPKLAGGAPLALRAARGATQGALGFTGYDIGAGQPPSMESALLGAVTGGAGHLPLKYGVPAQAAVGGYFGTKATPGDPITGGGVGAVLGAAFPLLTKYFGLGREKLAERLAKREAPVAGEAGTLVGTPASPKPGEAPGAPPAAGTPAPTPTPAPAPAAPARRTTSSVAEEVAQKNFGKKIKDLDPAERAQMGKLVAAEKVAYDARREAEKAAAAKQKKDIIEEAKKIISGQKEEAAKKTATEQAKQRVEGKAPAAAPAPAPAATPAPKAPTKTERTVAKAAQENPAVAKIMGSVELSKAEAVKEGKGTSAAQMISTPPKTDPDLEIESAKHEIQKAKDILKNPNATAEEKRIAEGNKKFWEQKHEEMSQYGTINKEALALIKRDPKRFAAFEKMSVDKQKEVLTKAREAVAKLKSQGKAPEVTKVPEGVHGTGDVARRAKDAERKRIARAEGKAPTQGRESSGGGIADKIIANLEKAKINYTPERISMMDVPDLEEAIKELPDGEMLIESAKAAIKQYKLPQEAYVHSLQEIFDEQIKNIKPTGE